MEVETNGIVLRLPAEVLRSLVKECVAEVVGELAADGALAFTEVQAAKLLNIPRAALREARVLGRVHPTKIGKRYLYSRSMLNRLIGG